MKKKNVFVIAFLLSFFLLQTTFSSAYEIKGWMKINLGPSDSNLGGIYFFNETEGLIVGGNVLYVTHDGGLTWDTISIQINDEAPMAFANDKIGWIVGTMFYKTTDGGETWTAMSDYILMPPQRIELYNETLGWAAGFNILYKMVDGTTWSQTTLPNITITTDLDFVSDKIGFVCGYTSTMSGILLKTEDGGLDWTQIFSAQAILSVFFFNELKGIITGVGFDANYHVWKTTDGGKNWNEIMSSSLEEYSTLYFVNERIGWMYVDNAARFYYTTDGGETWTKENLNTSFSLNYFFAIDAYHAWVSCDKGIVLMTTNGGIMVEEEEENQSSEETQGTSFDSSIDGYLTPLFLAISTCSIIRYSYLLRKKRTAKHS